MGDLEGSGSGSKGVSSECGGWAWACGGPEAPCRGCAARLFRGRGSGPAPAPGVRIPQGTQGPGSGTPPCRPSPTAQFSGLPPRPMLGPLACLPAPPPQAPPHGQAPPRSRPAARPFSCGSGVSRRRRRHKLPRWRRAGGCERRSGRAGRGAEPGRRREDGAARAGRRGRGAAAGQAGRLAERRRRRT